METTLVIIGAALLCSACGTYQLGYSKPEQGQTKEQFQLDMLACKDEMHQATANSTGLQAKQFLLGASLIGIPAGIELGKQKSREAYGACMTARGYKYTAP